MVCNCELRVDEFDCSVVRAELSAVAAAAKSVATDAVVQVTSLRLRPELVAVVAAIVSDEDEVSSSVGVGFGARHGMPQQRGLLHRQ